MKADPHIDYYVIGTGTSSRFLEHEDEFVTGLVGNSRPSHGSAWPWTVPRCLKLQASIAGQAEALMSSSALQQMSRWMLQA